MKRTERLKAKLFELDDRAVSLERVAIIERCAERYRDETAGRKFGHTLRELLSDLAVVIDEDDLIVDGLRFEDGQTAVPQKPGLGCELDLDALEKYRVDR